MIGMGQQLKGQLKTLNMSRRLLPLQNKFPIEKPPLGQVILHSEKLIPLQDQH